MRNALGAPFAEQRTDFHRPPGTQSAEQRTELGFPPGRTVGRNRRGRTVRRNRRGRTVRRNRRGPTVGRDRREFASWTGLSMSEQLTVRVADSPEPVRGVGLSQMTFELV